jgi:acetyl esterase
VLRADLHGLPPAFVITAECDPLRDDGEAYAEKLAKLGIRASYKRYDGMFHGFMSFANVLPEASEAFDDAGRALREALA